MTFVRITHISLFTSLFLLVSEPGKNYRSPFTTASSVLLLSEKILPLSLEKWDYFDEYSLTFLTPGEYAFDTVSDGLKFYSTEYRAGTRVSYKETVDFKNKTVYIKWKAYGNNNFTGFLSCLYYDSTAYGGDSVKKSDLSNCTTSNSWAGSALIADNKWYYTRIRFGENKALAVTATKNYDDARGKVIQRKKTNLKSTTGYIAFRMGDTYSKSSFTIISEVRIKSD